MSQYQMSISGRIELADYSSIHDYMSIVNKNDNIIITIDKSEQENIDILKRILEDNNFVVDLEQAYNERNYCIKASKNNQ